MQVSGILDHKGHDVASISPDTPISVAVHRMATKGVGCLLLLDEHGRLTGLSGARRRPGLARQGDVFLRLQARDVATPKPATCLVTDDVTSVMVRVTQSRQRHLPVLDAAGDLAGLVSIGDLVKSRLGDLEMQTNVLRDAYLAHR